MLVKYTLFIVNNFLLCYPWNPFFKSWHKELKIGAEYQYQYTEFQISTFY